MDAIQIASHAQTEQSLDASYMRKKLKIPDVHFYPVPQMNMLIIVHVPLAMLLALTHVMMQEQINVPVISVQMVISIAPALAQYVTRLVHSVPVDQLPVLVVHPMNGLMEQHAQPVMWIV